MDVSLYAVCTDAVVWMSVCMLCVQMLCAKGANTLQTKSQTVEEAANELINMLCDVEPREAAPEEEEEEDAGFDEEEVAEG